MIKRRLGAGPHADGTVGSAGLKGCPDLFELENGDFAVVGIDKTDDLIGSLPADASCGPDERIVVISRHILINAKSDVHEL